MAAIDPNAAWAQVGNQANPYMQGFTPPANGLDQLQSAGVNVGPVVGQTSPEYVKPVLGNAGGGKVKDYDPATMGPVLGVSQPPQPAAPTKPGEPPPANDNAGKAAPERVLRPIDKRHATAVGKPGIPGSEKLALAAGDETRGDRAETIGKRADILGQVQEVMANGEAENRNRLTGMESELETRQTNRKLYESTERDAAEKRHAEIEKEGADARAAKVDPDQWFKERGTAGRIMSAIVMGAGAFGANMPHSGGQNAAMQIINDSIASDIKGQHANIEQKWKGISHLVESDQQSYARGQFKMKEMREEEVQGTTHAMAMIDRVSAMTTDEASQAKLGQMRMDLQDKLTDLKEQHYNQRVGVMQRDEGRQAAANASAAAEARAREGRIRDHTYKMSASPDAELSAYAEKNGISIPEAAYRQARAVEDRDFGDADLVRNVHPDKGGAGSKLSEDEKGVRASNEFNKQLDDVEKSDVIMKSGLTEAALSHLGGRIAPGSSQMKTELDSVNTRLMQGLGKVAKDADGKPNKEMLERYEERFTIKLSDTPEQKQAKIRGVRDVVNGTSNQQVGGNAALSTAKKK
jgi:hypothetical protein